MTICIAAMCEKSKAIVAVSDRMITASYPAIEFEHNIPKIDQLSKNCVVLTAGDALAHIEICRGTKKIINNIQNPPISKISEVIKEAYSQERTKKAVEFFLKPRGIPTIDNFWENSQRLPPPIVGMIDRSLATHNLILDLIIAGVDD